MSQGVFSSCGFCGLHLPLTFDEQKDADRAWKFSGMNIHEWHRRKFPNYHPRLTFKVPLDIIEKCQSQTKKIQ
jgi:hypothetical protein